MAQRTGSSRERGGSGSPGRKFRIDEELRQMSSLVFSFVSASHQSEDTVDRASQSVVHGPTASASLGIL